jgi:hypothetical protein
MAKETPVCGTCGKALVQKDLIQGRIPVLQGKPVCAACRPAPKAAVPAARPEPGRGARPEPLRAAPLKAPHPAPAAALPKLDELAEEGEEPEPARKKLPMAAILGGGAGALVLVVVLILVFAGGRPQQEIEMSLTAATPKSSAPAPAPASVPVEPTAAPVTPPAPGSGPGETVLSKGAGAGVDPSTLDPEVIALRDLESYARTAPDPQMVLQRCAEARKKLTKNDFKMKLFDIEDAARRALEARDRDKMVDETIEKVRGYMINDRGYHRQAEVMAFLKKALENAGPRKPDLEKAQAEYLAGIERAAKEEYDRLRGQVDTQARLSRFDEAVKLIDTYPEQFRSTPHWNDLRALRQDIEVRRGDEDMRKVPSEWGVWRVSSGIDNNSEGAPRLLPEHGGRKRAFMIHPLDGNNGGSLEAERSIPAGKRVTLTFWVCSHPKGDFELRVIVDQVEKVKLAIGPQWKQVTVDLTSYAGKTILIRLEDRPTGWSNEYAYFADVQLKIQ